MCSSAGSAPIGRGRPGRSAPNCQSENLAWRTAAGTGEVHSWVRTHNVYAPAFASLVPYVTVLVRLDEQDDILIPGRFLSEVEPHQGMRVQAVAEKLTDDLGELELGRRRIATRTIDIGLTSGLRFGAPGPSRARCGR